MPLFKSLRSKSSRKSSNSVTSELDNGSDFGPRSPSSTTYGSMRSAKTGGTDYRSLTKVVSSSVPSSPPPSLPRYASSSSVRGDKATVGPSSVDEIGVKRDTSMMEAVNEVNPSTPTVLDPAMMKPRPSDLFAGKGVQWDAVKLAGPTTLPANATKANTNEELQNFLKMRRQWKPTFATESDRDGTTTFQPPEDLSQLTFTSDSQVQSQGLMSLKDLDESHQRKQHLLNSAPLGGSLWGEPETSKAASKRAADEVAAPNAKPPTIRKESGKGRKLFGGGEKSSSAPRAVNVRSSSAKNLKEQIEQNSISRAVPDVQQKEGEAVITPMPPGGLAPAITGSVLESHAAAVRESLESNGNQFETPNGSSSELVEEDGDKTLTTNGRNGSGIAEGSGMKEVPEEVKNLSVETAAIPKDIPTDIPAEPVTPRTVKESTEERSITPTPKDSEPVSTS